MLVIKRYPNRKLYDTDAKQYITLEGIAALIRQGQEVSVVDHATGEDLTAVTLTQIILEQEKRQGGFLPHSLLTGLIRAGGEAMHTVRRTLVSSLDLARQVDEEIERRLQALISRGELAAEEGQGLAEKLLDRHFQLLERAWTDEAIERTLARQEIPTRDDLGPILDQLERLLVELDELTRKRLNP
ncbi:MAG: polyhydroxyalkanoate synthesis regulator DNA-binding domain-containing protein [Anaerolineae bacterium]